jgi:agmatinase
MLISPKNKFACNVEVPTEEADVVIWGIPTDHACGSNKTGADRGPNVIRAASSQWHTIRTSYGVEFSKTGKITDIGDLHVFGKKPEEINNYIQENVPNLQQDQMLVTIGGDHSITLPIIKGSGTKYNLIYFDAHPDAVREYSGNTYSHACTLRRLIEDDLVNPQKTILVGHRAPKDEEMEFLNDHKIRRISSFDFMTTGLDQIAEMILETIAGGPTYMSIDLDVLDSSVVPGVQTPEPAGLTSRELLYMCNILAPHINACDLVEVTGERDPANLTAKMAARILIDLMGNFICNKYNSTF